MTESNGNNGQPQPAQFSEAPASVNLKFDYGGYRNIQLTLRASDGLTALKKLDAALLKLTSMGATPAVGQEGQSQGDNSNGNAQMCPTHGTQMKRSKHGDGLYCPQKIADDDGTGRPVYCKQKSK